MHPGITETKTDYLEIDPNLPYQIDKEPSSASTIAGVFEHITRFFFTMLSSLSQPLFSLLRLLRPKMKVRQEALLFNSPSPTVTPLFLYIMASWARESQDPESIANRFRVTCIIHSKHPDPPEHEYLLLEIIDQRRPDDTPHILVLERFASSVIMPEVPREDSDSLEKLVATFKKLLLRSSSLASLEEGRSSLHDNFSLTSVEAADSLMKSLKKSSGNRLAVDHFVGGDIFADTRYHGQVLQYFKPQNLTLFDLAIIAEVVHDANPYYEILNSQCYFYAALVYAAAEKFSTIPVSESADAPQTELVEIRGSYLSNRYGRWRGLKVTKVDPDSLVVEAILLRAQESRRRELDDDETEPPAPAHRDPADKKHE